MSLEDRLSAAPVVELARGALAGAGIDAWIVGGAVRDAALGGEVTDLDLAVAGSPEAAARAIAAARRRRTPSSSRPSSRPGGWSTARRPGRSTSAPLRGATIEADLAERDFTRRRGRRARSPGGEPIDPHGGLADLERRVLRVVGAGQLRRRPAAPAARGAARRRARARGRPGDRRARPLRGAARRRPGRRAAAGRAAPADRRRRPAARPRPARRARPHPGRPPRARRAARRRAGPQPPPRRPRPHAGRAREGRWRSRRTSTASPAIAPRTPGRCSTSRSPTR